MPRSYAPGPDSPGAMAGEYRTDQVSRARSAIHMQIEWLRPPESPEGGLVRGHYWDGLVVTPLGYVRVYASWTRVRRGGAWTNDFERRAGFYCIYQGREHRLHQEDDECCGFSARALAREAHRFARAVVNNYRLERRG